MICMSKNPTLSATPVTLIVSDVYKPAIETHQIVGTGGDHFAPVLWIPLSDQDVVNIQRRQ